MKKLLLFTSMVCLFSLAAQAQIATPYLDASAHSKGPAAAGWRYTSIVSAYAGAISDSKVTSDQNSALEMREIGDLKKTASVPPVTAAYRGETFAAELLYSSGIETEASVAWKIDPALTESAIKSTETEDDTRVNLAYVLGETISIGVGYWAKKLEIGDEGTVDAGGGPSPVSFSATVDVTTFSAMVSWRLMDIFYLAGGIENQAMGMESSGLSTVDNSWMNTVAGVGVVFGDPDDMQFRLEYAMIQSPESKKDAEGTKLASAKSAFDTTYSSLEAKFGSFLLSYRAKKKDEKAVDTQDAQIRENTSLGVGLMPLEGLSVMAYAETSKKTTSGTNTKIAEGNGYALTVSWLF